MTTVFPLPNPTLPEFTTLLLKGPYHASAPIHLCLTHLANRPGSRAVLLTPSRENFVAALRDFDDDWLNECGGYGAVTQNSVTDKLKRLPTQLPVYSGSGLVISLDAEGRTAWNGTVTARNRISLSRASSRVFVVFPQWGDLWLSLPRIVLVSGCSCAHHTEIVVRAGVPVPRSLVLMDSRLDGLNLPVLKPDIPGPGVADLEGPNSGPYRVASLMDHYFEWVGTFETEPSCMLRLRETAGGDERVVKWRRMAGQIRAFGDRPGSVIVCDQTCSL